jgi:gliding motility-associated-like protein
VHYPFGNQVYTITIKRPSGCVTTDTLLVRLFQDQAIYVAGGFTPNGDNINDLAYPILVGTTELKYFKIFNRWGQLVFQTNTADAKKGWDGRYKGVAQPSGTYTWTAEAIGENNIPIIDSGVLSLIR